MAYSSPPTFISGATLTAAQLNTLGDDLNYLKGVTDGVVASGVQINRTSSTSIADTTYTNITWQSEAFDYGSWYSSGTNIVCPAGAIPAGFTTILVHCVIRVQFATNATGLRRVLLLKGGVEFARQTFGGLTGDPTDIVMVDYTTVASGDIITAQVYQTSTGALNLTTAILTVIRHAPAA